MIHCGSSHQRMHGAGSSGNNQAHEHHHAMDHGAAPTGADHHHTAAADASAQPDKYADLAQFKCSACGSCCSSAAMPGCSLAVPEPTPVVHWQSVHFVARFGFVTDGPDRPPRPVLA
jgi:hypothetical protein